MVEHIHRIGSTKPILELENVDPDTGIAIPLGSLTNPKGYVRFYGAIINAVDAKDLQTIDGNAGRFDMEFLATDFTSPRQTGKAVLWMTGDLPSSKVYMSEPIEIEIREPWEI